MNKHERYNRSAKGKARSSKYKATDKGQLNQLKHHSKWNLTKNSRRIKELESLLETQIQKYMELVDATEN